MKSVMKTVAAGAVLALGMISASQVSAESFKTGGESERFSIKASTVKAAVEQLGYSVSEHKDADGNPHLVIEDGPSFTKGMAVFMADCGSAGCEDLVFYADFGPSEKATTALLNEWNHPASNLRSTAFRSGDADGDGPVGISMVASFYDDSEQTKVAWLAGIFVVEVNMFGASLGHK